MLEVCLDNLLYDTFLSEEEMGFKHLVVIVLINHRERKQKLKISKLICASRI